MQISGCRGEGKDQRNGHGRQVCKRIQKEVAIGFEFKLKGRKKNEIWSGLSAMDIG